jgi:multidrug resistance protein, MATE family
MLTSHLILKNKNLTRYPLGSLRELWHISFPLMISLMSTSLMLFLDRLFLAHYSLDALHAAARAGTLVQFLQFWCLAVVSIAEVFVGRYNGANRLNKLGMPVWQMIWFSLATSLIYIPLGIWGGSYGFFSQPHQQLENIYFSWLCCLIPFSALSTALAAFFIGKGEVRFVTAVMIGTNIINVLLDTVLIFGVEGWIPSYGMAGAAIATGFAQLFQVIIFFTVFIKKSNRINFGTGRWKFKKKLFFRCLWLGVPNAVVHSLEILAWVLIFDMLTDLGPNYMTIVTISQSILFLFTFITEGLSKGATTVASNLIGADRQDLVWRVLKSGVKFYVTMFILLSGLLVWNPDSLINWFVPHTHLLDSETRHMLHMACFWVWLFFLFDGVSWLLIGLLIAAGDARFVLKVGGISPILMAWLPVYLIVFYGGAPAHFTWMLIALYALISGMIYYYRFYSEQWKTLSLV